MSAVPARSALSWFARVILVWAIAMAVAGWIAFVFPPLDLANQFLPIWFGAGLGAIVLLAALAGWRRGLLLSLLVLAASGLPPLVREASNRTSDAGVSRQSLKIVQFNVLKDNETPQAVVRWVLTERPDIVTLEETLGSNRAILNGLRSHYPHQVSCLTRMRCSTVILSRERPVASGGLARGDPENQRALSAAWATFSRSGRPFTVVAVHMVRPWPWGEQDTGRRQLAEFLHSIDTQSAIVAGDFNLTPWTVAMHRQDAMFGMNRRTRLLPTWPAMTQGRRTPAVMPIDHIYAGARWTTRSVDTGPYLGSDHLPVVAKFDRVL